jgi:hypothetical protein
MVALPQCSFPKADIAKGMQYLRGSMTAMGVKMRFRGGSSNVRKGGSQSTGQSNTTKNGAHLFMHAVVLKTVCALPLCYGKDRQFVHISFAERTNPDIILP